MRDAEPPASVTAALRLHAQRTPAAVAVQGDNESVTYAQLWQRTDHAMQALHAAGVQAGDRVAWLGLNDAAQLVLLVALARLSAILLPLNYRLAHAERFAILQDAQARLLVADAAYGAVAEDLANACACPSMAATDLTHPAHSSSSAPDRGQPHDPLLLVYTSGTSGHPKGALHTQLALAWNCAMAIRAQNIGAADRILTVLPLFHVGGLCIQTLPALVAGATVVMHRRFDASAWLRSVQTDRVTLSVMVPATLRAVQEHADFATVARSSLRMVVTGSSVVPLPLIERLHARGIPVGQVYGTTETGPVSIVLGQEDAMRHPGSAGKAAWKAQIRLLDPQGVPVAAGQVGEICVRAPNVMQAYWNIPNDPAFQDGWFHSGDLARLDAEGFYWVVGRSKDMIISGGENIYPAEIENILAGHPDVVDVAVLGIDDAAWGEVVVAVVVRRVGATLDEAAVRAALVGQLARYKLPRRVVFLDSLPKTALGKVQRAELAMRIRVR